MRVLPQLERGAAVLEDYARGRRGAIRVGMECHPCQDWLMRVVGDGTPHYNAAHVLHETTGRDVMTFGFRGGHPTLTYVFQATAAYAGIKLYWGIDLAQPNDVVVYFYEGNDINDELANLKFLMGPGFDQTRAGERAYIAETIARIGADGVKSARRRWHALRNAHMFDTSTKLVKLAIQNASRGVGRILDPADPAFRPNAGYKENWSRYQGATVFVGKDDGGRPPYPVETVEPFAFQTDAEIALVALWYEEALKYLSRLFPGSRIWVSYIPTPIMAYRLASETAVLRDLVREAETDHPGPPTTFTNAALAERSNATCARIFQAARAAGTEFIDTRPAWRAAAGKLGYLHGPNDPGHPNEMGYRVLAEAIQLGMVKPDTAAGCARLK